MIQAEIYCRAIRIRYLNNAATCFSIENHGEQFLVTAKHLFKCSGYPSNANIELLIGSVYQTFDVYIRYPANQNIDIAVMKLREPKFLTPTYNNVNSIEGLIYGQTVYFVGFPFEYDNILNLFPGEKKPIPFVKQACVSAILRDNAGTIILDGINNPGFSGGPVCFKKMGTDEKTMRILGVISGYRHFRQPLFDMNDNKTDFYIIENTGLIIVHDIKYAVQITEKWV